MMLVFSLGAFVGYNKLMTSNSIMLSLISMEVIMSSLIMMVLALNKTWDQSNFLIMTICLVVCEGAIGLSILSTVNKLQANKFLYKTTSSVK